MNKRLPMDTYVGFFYTNHRGMSNMRRVRTIAIEHLSEPGFGYEPGWFLRAFDLDKNAERSFELARIPPDSITVI